MRRPGALSTAIGLLANLLTISFGAWAIAAGATVGGVLVVLFGSYFLVVIVASLASRYGRAEKLTTAFALLTFIAVPAWLIVVTALSVSRGGSVVLAVFAFAVAGTALFYGARGLIRWAQARR
jgi:O-antigen/teichoic acid export membrane protein